MPRKVNKAKKIKDNIHGTREIDTPCMIFNQCAPYEPYEGACACNNVCAGQCVCNPYFGWYGGQEMCWCDVTGDCVTSGGNYAVRGGASVNV